MRRMCLTMLVLLLFLVGCSVPHSTEISTGEPLRHEEQASLYEQQLGQDGAPGITTKGTVYWSPSGTKYHKDPNCSYLKNAKELLSGTAAEAVNHGASQPCSRCAGG